MTLFAQFAAREGDSEEIRLEKSAIALVSSACCLAGLLWTAMYLALFGPSLTTALPGAFVVIVGAALALSHRTGNHRWVVYAQIICIIQITVLIQWSIGSPQDSGFVMVWSLLGPMGAFIFFSPRESVAWLVFTLANLLITALLQPELGPGHEVSEAVQRGLLVMNGTFSTLVLFGFAGYFVQTARRERARAEALILNTLPVPVANRLRAGETLIADEVPDASVLFADMVGSTPLFAGLSAAEAVDWLNEAFTAFDRLIEAHGAEKIRTIGDNYMIAAGVPEAREDHADLLVGLALEMAATVEAMPERHGRRMAWRFGIHSGPMVAGVIGETRFQYDLWGDTVNCAARMESQGEPGRVHISEATRERLSGTYEIEARGAIVVKGRGEMETHFVTRSAV